jgi:hypothetical protein
LRFSTLEAVKVDNESKRVRLLQGKELRFAESASREERFVDPSWIVEAATATQPITIENAHAPGQIFLNHASITAPISIQCSECEDLTLEHARIAEFLTRHFQMQ